MNEQIYTSPFQGYDTGVQGLIQLGRNAIDRVSELERGISERDETIRQLRAQLDEYERAPTFTYMYRFPHMGGFVWRHSSSDFNGARPVESIELIARRRARVRLETV